MTVEELYERTRQEALDEGIPHQSDCPKRDSGAPLNECACQCHNIWWFKKAMAAAKEHH